MTFSRNFLAAVLSFSLFTISLISPDILKGETTLDLGDAIHGLKVLTRQADPAKVPLDINSDGKIGPEEVVFILQYLSGDRRISESTFTGITVSGTIKDNQTTPAAVAGILVEINADLNEDGSYSGGEQFSDITDSNGFFSIFIPTGPSAISRMTLQSKGAGYSSYFKSFEDIQESFNVDITIAGGTFFEIDIAGIPSAPSRAGRVSLNTDKEVSISLTRDRVTGRTSGRAGLGRFAAPPSGVDGEVLSVSFPLRGLLLPAGSEKIYANVAYLDTANEPETMPGSFMAEAEGNTPKDVLQTYAASMIRVSDENGNDLMTDPFDFSKTVNIKIALPPEVYDSIVDEDETTTDKIEMPLYYFDETEEIWKLHRDANGDPVYGWLMDNFGNVLDGGDLQQLQTIFVDADGNYTGTAYLPAGVTSSDDVTIFEVGTVNHFTTWNCDRAGRSTSMNFDLVGPDGKPRKPPIRFRKKIGGWSSDKCTPSRKSGKCNTHTNRDAKAYSIMKKLLGKDKAQRDQYLRWVVNNSDPEVIQALFDAMWRYSNDKRAEWSGDSNELRNGLRAIFSNKMLTDAIGDTVEHIDCSKAPDLCKGALARAAEEVGKASDAKKAVAFLMQIAVDSYRPGNLDFDYVLDKGIGMIELSVNSASKSGELGSNVLSLVNDLKNLRSIIKGLYNNGRPPRYSDINWSTYRGKIQELREKIDQIKTAAEIAGRRMGRTAALSRTAALTVPQTEEELSTVLDEITWDYEDIGGMFYGAHKFSQWQWGYYEGDRFIQTAPPANLAGGGEVGVWEYYNGSAWVPLPGRSSQGVDAGHIPVPNVLSFGSGSPSAPAAYLGRWVIDTKPNVEVSGRLVGNDGTPHVNASKVPINVGGAVFYADSTGAFSGMVSLYQETARVTIPGSYWQYWPVVNNRIELGDIVVADRVVFNKTDDNITSVRNTPIDIDASAFALSASPISYVFKLKKSYWSQTVETEQQNNTGLLTLPGFEDVGTYYLEVTATADKDLGDGTRPSEKRTFIIRIKNQPPVINTINLPTTPVTVGDTFTVILDVSDPDSDSQIPYDDIRSQYIRVICKDDNGFNIYLGSQQNADADGNMSWTVRTDNSRLYQLKAAPISCTAMATVYDKSGASDYLEQDFTIDQNHLPPEIRSSYISGSYAATYTININPGYIWFMDLNNDIASYELDCGKGDGPIVSSRPIRDIDPNTEGNQGCLYDTPKTDTNGQVIPYEFSYKAVDKGGREAVATSLITIYGPLDMAVTYPSDLTVTPPGQTRPDGATVNDTDFDIVELPTGADRSFSLGITASSPNGDNTLAAFSYTVRYQPANAYWWTTLAGGDANVDGTGSINVEISKPGQYYVFTNARDNAGVWASFSKTFFVTSEFDFEQTINGTTVDQAPAWFLSTDTITFAHQLLDSPDGFAGGYQWDIDYDSDGSYTAEGTGTSLQKTLPAGTHKIRLTLSNTDDSQQPPVVKETTVTVYDPLNLNLTTTYEHPVDTAVAAGDQYTLSVSGVPQGVTLQKVYWRVTDSNNTAVDSGTYTVINGGALDSRTFVFSAPGNYIVHVQAVDSRGLSGTASMGFEVKDYVPNIDDFAIDTNIGPPPLTVSLTSTSSDADGTVENYIWQVTGQATDANGQVTNVNETYVQNAVNSTTPQNFAYTFNDLGTYRITLTVEDNSGRKSAPSFKDISVLYRPPVISRLIAEPSTGGAPLSTTLTATASDVDGDITDYSWDIGADGSIEQSGQQNTFTHTFNNTGTYEVKLTVTDSQNLTATRSLNIYVFAADQGATFNFRELWADGLGPALDFTQYEASAQPGEGAPNIVLIGPTTPIDAPQYTLSNDKLVMTGNTSAGETVMPLTQGYNGFYVQDYYGGPALDLFNIKGNGIYDVGLIPPIGYENPATFRLNYPPQYNCGSIFFSNNSVDFGINYDGTPNPPDPAGQYSGWGTMIYPYNAAYINKQGELGVVALLGTEVNGACVHSFAGFSSATIWPDTDPANPIDINIDGNFPISTKTLVIPAGYEFKSVVAEIDGMRIEATEYDVQSFANGNIPIPIIPDADYEFEFSSSAGSGSNTVDRTLTMKFTAAEIASSATIEPELTALPSNTVSLTKMPSTVRELWFVVEGNDMTITSKASSMSGSETSLSNILTFNEADTIRIAAFDGNGNILQARRIAMGDFTGTVDFTNSLAPDVTLADAAINVDQVDKTLTLSYSSSEPACLIDMNLSFDNARSRVYRFLTDGTAGSSGLTVSYPIPDIPDPWTSEPITGTDALSSAQATVQCFTSIVGYEELIRNLLEKIPDGQIFDNYSWTTWAKIWWAVDQLGSVETSGNVNITLDIGSGTYTTAQQVTPTVTGSVSSTRYTLDGSEPDQNSPEYTGGTIEISGTAGQTVVLKIVSYDSEGKKCITTTAAYTFQ
jgi:PKD repeat protein